MIISDIKRLFENWIFNVLLFLHLTKNYWFENSFKKYYCKFTELFSILEWIVTKKIKVRNCFKTLHDKMLSLFRCTLQFMQKENVLIVFVVFGTACG